MTMLGNNYTLLFSSEQLDLKLDSLLYIRKRKKKIKSLCFVHVKFELQSIVFLWPTRHKLYPNLKENAW